MKPAGRISVRRPPGWLSVLLVGLLVAGCQPPERELLPGYAEGEFVYVSSALPGTLGALAVERGDQAKAGELLFALENGAEAVLRTQAAVRLEEGQARLADARKGRRPPEMAALAALLDQGRTALALADKEWKRQSNLNASGAASTQELDRAKSVRDQARQRVAQLEADRQAAELGARDDQVVAAEANVRALAAALAKAEWDIAQKHQAAPVEGLVFDTLYRPGEWVPAGRPVVVLLPPANLKVRTFVPESRLTSICPGDRVQVRVDGVAEPFPGKVSFISPRAEFTPPVIYSQESRGKLVFLVEVGLDPEVAARLHPGQPVDVSFSP